MGKIGMILKMAKKSLDKSSDIEKSLKQMTNVSVSNAQNAQSASSFSMVKTSNFIRDAIIFAIVGFVIFLNLDRLFSLNNFVIDLIPDFVYFKEVLGLIALSLLIIFALMLIFDAKSERFDLFYSIAQIFMFVCIFAFLFGFFLNQPVGDESGEVLVDKTGQKTFSIFDQIKCYATDYRACKEKQENTDTATKSELTTYEVDFIKPVISNYKDLADYQMDGLRVQYDIESTGNLKLIEFRCYFDKKRVDNIFYSEELDEVIGDKNSGLETFYCKNFTKEMFDDKNGDVKLNIYPMLIFELESTINQQVPVLNYQSFSSDDLKKEMDTFAKDYTEFTDTGSKLEIKSENFKKQMPVILGDDEITDRSFTIEIRNKISTFGKFYSGEITDIIVPSSLKLTKDKSRYLEEIELYDDVHGIELDVEDNEEFYQNLRQDKIVQNLQIEYISNFQKSNTVEIRVNVPKETSSVSGGNNNSSSSDNTGSSSSSGGSTTQDPSCETREGYEVVGSCDPKSDYYDATDGGIAGQ